MDNTLTPEENIVKRIRELRNRDGRTQEVLAEELGVTAQAVSRWEKGICYPDMEIIPSIANYFGVSIDELFGYDNDRARKTADGINLYHMLDIHIDDELAEIDAGDWEGKYLTDIEQIYPEQYSNWNNAPAVFAAPNGESMAQVYQRVSNALVRIISENKGKTICIVSHGCAIKNMMCFAHGWDIDSIQQVPLGTNTAVNVVTFDDNMKPTVVIENYTDHLS